MTQNVINNKLLTNPAKAEQIIEYCRQKFINILPNKATRPVPQANKSTSPNEPPGISSISNIIYKKQQVKQVMRQLSMFLQLVIQNCLLSSDTRIRAESYRILGNFRNFLSRDLDQFETMIYNRNKSKLPFYEVDCRDFFPKNIELKMPPQVSLYQDPLLFYIYTKYAQEELFINHPMQLKSQLSHVTRQERIQILKHHSPFLEPLLIPIVSERLETKAKFSELEDRLILIMLKSKLDVSEYRAIYFPQRAESQIKNRIKNLCGNSNTKELNNPIKEMKQNEYMPLTPSEIQQLEKGFAKFGTRWPVIAKYYQLRSAEFLALEYEGDVKHSKRRIKQSPKPHYQSLRTILEAKIESANRKKQPEVMQVQNPSVEQEAIDQEKHEAHNCESSQQPIEEEAQYKIINHLTFEYYEI